MAALPVKFTLKVTLGEYGLFVGKLFATHVEISGQFNGELVCDTLNVRATGKIDGSVKADTLSIDSALR